MWESPLDWIFLISDLMSTGMDVWSNNKSDYLFTSSDWDKSSLLIQSSGVKVLGVFKGTKTRSKQINQRFIYNADAVLC